MEVEVVQFRNHGKKMVIIVTLVIVAILVGTALAVYILDNQYRVEPPLRGFTSYIKADGVKVNAYAIFWVLRPNSTKTNLIYVQNIRDTPVTLTLRTSNWTPPEAQTYMTLSWNYTGQTLNSKQTIPILLTLTISPEIKGIVNGAFFLNITAT